VARDIREATGKGVDVKVRPIIDLDDVDTWPDQVRRWSEDWTRSLDGTTRYASDLPLPPLEDEDAFWELLNGYRLRAFHATKLFDHEVIAIRNEGLRPCSEQLIADRINRAEQCGHLGRAEAAALRSVHVFSPAGKRTDLDVRMGEVCAVFPESRLESDAPGLERPLSWWGGEVLYMGRGSVPWRRLLAKLGRPTIVVVAIDLSNRWTEEQLRIGARGLTRRRGEIPPCLTFPDPRRIFVGAMLSLPKPGGELHYRAAVPPEDVLDVWQPGHPSYDRIDGLPKE
jgi:hypothetical protein